MRVLLHGLAVLSFCSLAYADPQLPNPTTHAWFYNNASASVAQFETDIEQCEVFGAERATGSGAHQPWGLTGAVVLAMIESGSPATFADDCMMAKGYARYDVSGETLDQFHTRYAAMSDEEKGRWISGAVPPAGVLSRHPSNTNWLAAPNDSAAELRPVTPATYTGRIGRFSRPRSDFGDLALAPGQVLLIGSIGSLNGDLAVVTLTRVDPSTGRPDPLEDQRRIVFGTRSREPVTMGIVVEAGTYALTNSDMTEFCLGTIAFDAAAGAVIDLGLITVDEEPTASGDSLAPVPTKRVRVDARPSPLREALMGRSRRVEPASYVNGMRVPCHAAMRQSIAGIAMPGAPYRPD